MLNCQILGLEQVIKNIKVKPEQAKIQIKAGMNVGCQKVAEETKSLISATGTPDGVPRRVSGNLMSSIKVGRLKEEGNKMVLAVGANPDTMNIGYAAFLEFGTSRMKPRPYLTLVFQKDKEFVLAKINEAMKKIC